MSDDEVDRLPGVVSSDRSLRHTLRRGCEGGLQRWGNQLVRGELNVFISSTCPGESGKPRP